MAIPAAGSIPEADGERDGTAAYSRCGTGESRAASSHPRTGAPRGTVPSRSVTISGEREAYKGHLPQTGGTAARDPGRQTDLLISRQSSSTFARSRRRLSRTCRASLARDPARSAGVLHVDGHVRAYFGTRTAQKTHVARLKFPAPATAETWVTDAGGDPVFMVVAEPSQALAGEPASCAPCSLSCAGS